MTLLNYLKSMLPVQLKAQFDLSQEEANVLFIEVNRYGLSAISFLSQKTQLVIFKTYLGVIK